MRANQRWAMVAMSAVLALLALATVPNATGGAAPDAGTPTLFVARDGDDANPGSSDAPLRTIGRAVQIAPSGSRIEVGPGTYHESVTIEDKGLTIVGDSDDRPVIDGAVVLDEWTAQGGGRFTTEMDVVHRVETGPNVGDNPVAGHPDQVFVDGRPLEQVLRRNELEPGRFFMDRDARRIWIADDPAGKRVIASTLPFAFYFDEADGSQLANFVIRRFATPRRDMAAVRGYSDDLLFSGLDVTHNARMGLSLIGRGVVVRDSRMVDNGHLGLHAHDSDGVVAERLAVLGNNKAGFDPFYAAGGIKITTSRGVTVRDSDVSLNDGVGIWTDLSVDGATIVGNIAEGNGRSGIEVELSSRVNVVDNVAIGNGEYGVWVLESGDVQVFHNAMYGNESEIVVLEGPRRDVQRVRIRNNLLGNSRSDSEALMKVEDWTFERSAHDMAVLIDNNGYWIPPESVGLPLLLWDEAPGRSLEVTTLKALRRLRGQSTNSFMLTTVDNRFVRDLSSGDYRASDGMRLGAPVEGSMAGMLRVAAGTSLPFGPVSPSPLRR